MHPVNVYACTGRCIIMKHYYESLFSTPTKTYVHEGNTSRYQNEGHYMVWQCKEKLSALKIWVHSVHLPEFSLFRVSTKKCSIKNMWKSN